MKEREGAWRERVIEEREKIEREGVRVNINKREKGEK